MWILNRATGTIVGGIGSMGNHAGQFIAVHTMAVDSKGTLYVSEGGGVGAARSSSSSENDRSTDARRGLAGKFGAFTGIVQRAQNIDTRTDVFRY